MPVGPAGVQAMRGGSVSQPHFDAIVKQNYMGKLAQNVHARAATQVHC